MAEHAEPRSLRCVVVSPERALLDQAADFVALPMFDGELGVAPGRTALIGRLGCGELRIKKAGAVERYYVDGGFAQIRANVVTVLTTKPLRKTTEIDADAARRMLEATRKPEATPAAQAAQRKNQERARAQLRLAGKT